MAPKLYQIIYRDLKKHITGGRYKVGDKLPTEFELIEQYSVSRVTAIKALNMLRDEGFIRRIPKVGSIICRVTEREGISYSGNSKQIALILPIKTDAYRTILMGEDATPRLLSEINSAADEYGYKIKLMDSQLNSEYEREMLKSVLSSDVAGVICFPADGGYENFSSYAAVRDMNIPIVTIDKWIGDHILDIPCITTDNMNGARKITEHIIANGHTKIGFCCDSLGNNNQRCRFNGYLQALMSHKLTYDPEILCEVYKDQRPMYLANKQTTEKELREYLGRIIHQTKPPTAVVCAFDQLAFQLVQQAQAMGIRVPDQLSVTGFDNLFICELLEPALTTMEQNFAEIGRTAFKTLHAMICGKEVRRVIQLDAKLITRNSVKNLNCT